VTADFGWSQPLLGAALSTGDDEDRLDWALIRDRAAI
jgi:hypothetical protein